MTQSPIQPLKNCPFCGGQSSFFDRSADQVWIECLNQKCGIRTSIWGGRQPALHGWNRRYDSEQVKALEEKVAGLTAALNESCRCDFCGMERDGIKEDWDQRCDLGVARDESIRDSATILAKVRALAKAEAFEEASKGAGCECSTASPVECSLCGYAMHLLYKAAALRKEAA